MAINLLIFEIQIFFCIHNDVTNQNMEKLRSFMFHYVIQFSHVKLLILRNDFILTRKILYNNISQIRIICHISEVSILYILF